MPRGVQLRLRRHLLEGRRGAARGPAGPPFALVATPVLHGARITWAAPFSTGGSPITGYLLTVSPGGLTRTAPVSLPLEAVFDGLQDRTNYIFTVAARNALGLGADSVPTSPVVTPGPPDAPVSVAVSVPSSGVAAVSWTPRDNGAPVIAYTVTLDPPDGTATVAVTNATVSALHHGTAYTFRVYATNAVGVGPASTAAGPITP